MSTWKTFLTIAGGFGSVLKVQHKLDGGIYALKKIPFKHESLKVEQVISEKILIQQVLREVKTLARLDHPNICRYYRAWLEPYQNSGEEEQFQYEGDGFGDNISDESENVSVQRTL